MQYELVESTRDNSQVTYDFLGFDDWKAFNKIINTVKKSIKPNKVAFYGSEDFYGFFEKDGLLVEIWHNKTKGNYLEFKGEASEKNVNKIRLWVKLIFSELMFDNLKKNA